AESRVGVLFVVTFFFFSSRRRHTRFSRDWSSDVCSSDLGKNLPFLADPVRTVYGLLLGCRIPPGVYYIHIVGGGQVETHAPRLRSEERRVGKEGRSPASPSAEHEED